MEQSSTPEAQPEAEIQEKAFLKEIVSTHEREAEEQALEDRASAFEKEEEFHARQSLGFHIACETNGEGTAFSLVERRLQTVVPSSNRTYACLVRGYPHPIKSAMSGWSELKIGKTEGCLDRRIWLDRVFRLYDIMRHPTESHPCDGNELPGSFYACHAEKQLIAFFLYQHTRILDDGFNLVNCSLNETWRPENEEGPKEIKMDIYVSNEPCLNCKSFADRVAGFCGARFRLCADVKHVNAIQ